MKQDNLGHVNVVRVTPGTQQAEVLAFTDKNRELFPMKGDTNKPPSLWTAELLVCEVMMWGMNDKSKGTLEIVGIFAQAMSGVDPRMRAFVVMEEAIPKKNKDVPGSFSPTCICVYSVIPEEKLTILHAFTVRHDLRKDGRGRKYFRLWKDVIGFCLIENIILISNGTADPFWHKMGFFVDNPPFSGKAKACWDACVEGSKKALNGEKVLWMSVGKKMVHHHITHEK